jgi:hypothetical protein
MTITAELMPTSYTSQESLLKPEFLRNGRLGKNNVHSRTCEKCQAFAIPTFLIFLEIKLFKAFGLIYRSRKVRQLNTKRTTFSFLVS